LTLIGNREAGVTVSWRREGAVAHVILDNPPVNAIGHAMRAGLLEACGWVEGEAGLERVILTGRGMTFAAGADAREFDAPPVEPHLPDVLARLETCSVPWIAAINGAALGGGAEIALACRYRVAAPAAQIGFPEVTLGVVPGAGGTQRLPRLVGLAAALDLVATGKAITSARALEIGLIDGVDAEPVRAAETLALTQVESRPPLSRWPAPSTDLAAIETQRQNALKRMAGQAAPLTAIDLVARSADLPFDAAMRAERAAFLRLRAGEQARALRHLFFAERAARVPDWLKGTKPVEVKKAVVVGGGNMGAAIAYALLLAGMTVVVIETDEEGVKRGRANIERISGDSLKRGLITAEKQQSVLSRLTATTDYTACADAELAIEAAFESMEVKHQVLAALQSSMPADAVLATNTSYLDIDEMAAALDRPERLLGLHFFAPAHVMKLLEIVRAGKTSDIALATGFEIARRLKKIPVLAGVCDGFIGNRILARYREIADMVMMDGSNPWEVDEAMVEFGYAMGPYEAQDLSGLDIAYANRKRQASARDPSRRYVPIADRMVHEGRLGRKVGVGWYRYPGVGGKVIDPLVEDLVREEAYFAKVPRRDFKPDEIRRRLLLAVINEAANILHEGMAASASDIDLVLVHGYGFPRWRGGLMHYADTLGAVHIRDEIAKLAEEDPVVWRLSPLVEACADSGKRFAEV
jgi:3-hydroxyacyl-CoA dehydrogenase